MKLRCIISQRFYSVALPYIIFLDAEPRVTNDKGVSSWADENKGTAT